MQSISQRAIDRLDKPRNYGAMTEANAHAAVTGPCGDTVEIWLRVDNGRVQEASFTTTGCGLSRACGSIATELAAGRPISASLEMEQADILEELLPFPESHLHCALLAATVMQAAAKKYVAAQEEARAKEINRKQQGEE